MTGTTGGAGINVLGYDNFDIYVIPSHFTVSAKTTLIDFCMLWDRTALF